MSIDELNLFLMGIYTGICIVILLYLLLGC